MNFYLSIYITPPPPPTATTTPLPDLIIISSHANDSFTDANCFNSFPDSLLKYNPVADQLW